MKKILPLAIAAVFATSAQAEKEFCETGTTRCLTIPTGMKLIQVPLWWDPAHTVHVQKGAQPPGKPAVCDGDKCKPDPCDELAVGPAVCPK